MTDATAPAGLARVVPTRITRRRQPGGDKDDADQAIIIKQ